MTYGGDSPDPGETWSSLSTGSIPLGIIVNALSFITLAGSPPRNCSHQALPFVEAAAKAQLAGSIETQPGGHFAARILL